MKKCTYCGKVTSDDASDCPIDHFSLVDYTPPPQAEPRQITRPPVSKFWIVVGVIIGLVIFVPVLLYLLFMLMLANSHDFHF